MQTCAVCSSPLRLAARFCTRCGAPIHAAPVPLEAAVPVRDVAPKPEADSVTRAMTNSVVACTLWVVAWELATVLVVFG